MEISRVGSMIPVSDSVYGLNSKDVKSDFAKFLQSALAATVQTDAADKASNISAAVGESEDIHSIVSAAEKADIALRLTLQLRNKVVEAYQEVMRMQV